LASRKIKPQREQQEREYQACSSPQDLQLRQTTSECPSNVEFAAEFGYEVTAVKDATLRRHD
jgi:hypothetical protein